MRYPINIGCLWVVLLILLIGGTPLLVGVLRILGGLVLATLLAGLVLSWWIRRQAVIRYESSQSASHNDFVAVLVALLVRLAEIDAPMNRGEVAAIRRFFQETLGYRGERLLWIRDLIKASRRSSEPVESLCEKLRSGYGFQERFIVLQVLARIAESDGRWSPEERAFVEVVAAELGLRPFVGTFGERFQDSRDRGPRRAPNGAHETDEALSTLGLTQQATAAEIKGAWRKLSLENHPDRVAHLGPEFRALAEERMRKINRAYTRLKEIGRVD